MYITLDILQQRGIYQEYLDLFAKFYPNGVEALSLIKDHQIALDGLHWVYQFLDLNEEETAAYWEKISVTNSKGVHESDHIDGSSIISNSSQVFNSKEIYRSKEINNCRYVADSEYVNNSEQIGDSSFIEDSRKVIKSKNITNSENINDSTYIIDSTGVFRSNNVVNSHGIWYGENITECQFCANCKNLTNALFCQGISNGEYYLFNKPIDKIRFDIVAKQYKKFAPELVMTSGWQNHFGDIPEIKQDYRKHFSSIKEAFWQWVRTLPNYDPKTMFLLTFDPQFLS